jgi:hypothetical protein
MRFVLALTVLGCLASSLVAQRGAASDPKAMKEKLDKAVSQAKSNLIQSLQSRATIVKRSRMKPQEKLAALNEIEKEVSDFKDNLLPTSNEACMAVFAYLKTVQEARKPLAAYYTKEIDRAIAANNLVQANSLTREKVALDSLIGKLDQFTQGSTWKGSRIGKTGSGICGLWIKKLDGTTFEGVFHLGAENTDPDRMVVVGEIDGNRITFKNTTMIKGAARALVFKGFVFEDRLLADVGGIAVGRKPAAPSIIDLKLAR